MTITLPYEFDTTGVVKLILRGVLGVLSAILIGVGYSLLVSRDLAAALALLLVAAVVMYFGRLFHRNLRSSRGTITRDAVLVEPGELLGFRLAGAAGTFPIGQFEAVRMERVSTSTDLQVGPHERVCLVGKRGTPDILIARADGDAGRVLANELAKALRLPFEERAAPY